MHEVGAATRVRDLGGIDQRSQLASLGIDRSDLVGSVSCHQEVTLGRIPAAIVQELGGTDGGGLQVFDIRVVDQQNLTGFLDVDDPFRLDEGSDDGGNARLRMVFAINGHTTSGHDLARLEGVTIHDDVLGRPVGTGNGVLVFKALELGGINGACVEADLDFSHNSRFFHPQVDQAQTTVATNNVNITARSGEAGNMNRIAGLDDGADFLGITVDQGNFTGITQGDREHVVQVEVVHLLLRTLVNRNDDLPGIHRVLEAVLRRHIRRVLDVLGHQGNFVLGQNVVEVHHTAIGTVADDLFQTSLTQLERTAFGGLAFLVLLGPMRFQVLACCALTQHAVAACATLEVNLLCLFLFSSRQFRRLGSILCKGRTHGQCHRAERQQSSHS